MKGYKKILLSVALVVPMLMPTFAIRANAEKITTTATGYTKAEDVQYKTATVHARDGATKYNVVANWGARGETAVFLSTYAQDFYGENEQYAVFSQKTGGTSVGTANKNELYTALQSCMSSKQTYYTYYDGSKNARDFYMYTDCVSSDTSKVSLIYRGDMVTSAWNGGSIWNQEHMWPKSKLSTDKEIGDIMHLRPSNPSENSGRGNDAYGESSGYYTPQENVRGDCARIMLYMYVRWGSSKMWGRNGVIESADILLKWIAEDPVDTWEMGRNDSVQSITGTRNVFVDYPEYAWLLFGKEIPEDMATPSGAAKNTQQGGNTSNTPNIPNTPTDSSTEECAHEYSDWIVVKQATQTEDGAKSRVCYRCGDTQTEILPKTGNGQIEEGCESAIGLPMICVSLLDAVCVAFIRKKRNEE